MLNRKEITMDYNLIETFIIVCEVRNLTKASELLYKTQPTVSNRIKQLENILGFSLFIRHKGKQEVEITPKGENFLKIAKQLFDLYNELETDEEAFANSLIMCSPSSYKIPVAADICKRLMEQMDTHVTLYTYQTSEAYDLVAKKQIDLAFASRAEERDGVRCEPVFTQQYYVVKYCENPGPIVEISTDDLDVHEEIFQHWDNEFRIWHRHCFANKLPKIEVDSCNALRLFLEKSEYWTIIQESSLHDLQTQIPLQLYALTNPPPMRKCYLLTNQFPDRKNMAVIKKFKEILSAYIEEKAYCHVLWTKVK